MRFKFDWKLVFRNDVMGFTKTVELEDVASYGLAVTRGLDELTQKGYDTSDFELIELKRTVRG